MTAAAAPLIAQLARLVGANHVLHEGDLSAWEQDWRKRSRGKALAVVRPGSTQEVAAVVRACAAAGTPIVPQGGNTGLVVGGIYYRAQVAQLKLCASRAFWLVAYPSQGHEMLFDAHTRSFAALGGIPKVGRIQPRSDFGVVKTDDRRLIQVIQNLRIQAVAIHCYRFKIPFIQQRTHNMRHVIL